MKIALANAPIDAKTTLPNGRAVDGPIQLRGAIFGGRDLFVRSLTENLLMYAIGRELQAFDMPQVRGIVRRARALRRDRVAASQVVSTGRRSDIMRSGARPRPKEEPCLRTPTAVTA